MKAAGVSQRKIAAAVGAGQEGVKRWLDRYPPGPTPPIECEKRQTMTFVGPDWIPRAIELRKDGATIEIIARAIGVGETTVAKWLARNKIRVDIRSINFTHKEPPAWAEKAKAMKADGASWRAIEREFGVAVHTIRRHIDPGYAEYRQRDNQRYLDQGGWEMRKEREKKAKEAAQRAAIEKPRTAARELRAERFYNYREEAVRWGR
jgi:hypothetical protein